MKRILLIMVLLLLALLLVNGCSRNEAPQPTQTPSGSSSNALTGKNTAQSDKSLREFTREELAEYNGTNGKPAYITVQGVVYDVTNTKLWKLGTHIPMGQQLVAGQDLTSLMDKAPPNHQTPEFWANVPKVGNLKSTQ
ncbi:hypothetical protein JCM15765_43820 [Paradesulfitobacterium aromaticivorans]